MPQFSESRKAAAAAHSLPPRPEQVFRVHPLTERDGEPEVLDFLAERPVPTVAMRGLIRDNGFESPFNRGTFYACRGPRGALEGVALIGHHTLVEARSEGALRALAELAQAERVGHMIWGEQEMIRGFWNHYAPEGQAPRLFCRELLFEQRWPVRACEPVEGLRLATLEDLMLIMPVHAAMAYEECGVNPLDVDLNGFRLRCARRIENGRVWVVVEGGDLVFKADVASDTPECVYIEGVYVAPASRQQGVGLRCLSQLGRTLLGRAEVLCSLVNEQNLIAQSLFLKAGYRLRGYFDTIYLERGERPGH